MVSLVRDKMHSQLFPTNASLRRILKLSWLQGSLKSLTGHAAKAAD